MNKNVSNLATIFLSLARRNNFRMRNNRNSLAILNTPYVLPSLL